MGAWLGNTIEQPPYTILHPAPSFERPRGQSCDSSTPCKLGSSLSLKPFQTTVDLVVKL